MVDFFNVSIPALQLEQKIQHLNQVDADVIAENSRLQEV